MARTAVELPDPLENPAGGNATLGTDDLLAQLAGDEVDRLLSEADAAPPDPEHADRPASDAEAALAKAAADADADDAGKSRAAMDELFDEMDAADAASAAQAKATTKESDLVGGVGAASKSAKAVIEERADALVERARREADEAAVLAAAEPEPQDAPASAAAALAAEMDADEAAHAEALARITPTRPVAEPETADAAADAADGAEPAAAATTIDEAAVDFTPSEDVLAERVPFLVRVLEFVNAPLAGLSAGMREALGKIAIVTSVNAIAVFVYVLIFRKH